MQQFRKFITWRLCLAQRVLPLERGGSIVVGRGLAGYDNRPDHD